MTRLIETTLIACCLFIAAGCGGGPARVESTGGETVKARPASRAAAIAEDTLREGHFRQLWTSNVGTIDQLWFEGDSLYLTQPHADGDYRLIKVDADTGLIVWTHEISAPLEFRPTVYEYPRELQAARPTELFYIENDTIHCLNDEVGLRIYAIETDTSISTPVTAAQDQVFVGTWNRRVNAYGKDSRIRDWTYLTDGAIVAPGAVGRVDVYFGSEDGALYRFNAGAGYQTDTSWIKPTGGKITSEPLYYYERIYTGSYDYKVYCFEEFRGIERWSYPAGAPIVAPLFPFKDSIFAVTEDERKRGDDRWRIVALDQSLGGFQWERSGVKRVVAADPYCCYALNLAGELVSLDLTDGTPLRKLDVSGFDFVVGQDAQQGAERDYWGRFFVATGNGLIQAVAPRRR